MPPRFGRFLVAAKSVGLSCGHSSTRGGSYTVAERSSTRSILSPKKQGAMGGFSDLVVQLAAHPEHAAIIRIAPVQTSACGSCSLHPEHGLGSHSGWRGGSHGAPNATRAIASYA